jgi:hypothetical protein
MNNKKIRFGNYKLKQQVRPVGIVYRRKKRIGNRLFEG